MGTWLALKAHFESRTLNTICGLAMNSSCNCFYGPPMQWNKWGGNKHNLLEYCVLDDLVWNVQRVLPRNGLNGERQTDSGCSSIGFKDAFSTDLRANLGRDLLHLILMDQHLFKKENSQPLRIYSPYITVCHSLFLTLCCSPTHI